MTILHLSDTHNLHKQLGTLPMADVLVFSGDMSLAGSEDEIIDFLNWFMDQPHPHKLFVAGNHDDCLWGEKIEGLDANCHYLYNSGLTIEGMYFYGMPLFMADVACGEQEKFIQQIPPQTDVLITHQPPQGILSESHGIEYGSTSLLSKVLEIKPRLHLFGHIHDAYGIEQHDNTLFSNAAIVDEAYNLTNQPRLLTL